MTANPTDLMQFAQEPEPRPVRDHAPWKILVVDDDDDVHVMTEILLREVEFDGRALHFLHAFSGKAARDVFAEQDDIAVAFVDVVMEHDLAGLDLVRHVRDDLGNREVSLILRTGQPGWPPNAGSSWITASTTTNPRPS
ncbi:MAG: hypothetical protein NVV74_18525 [Magnetospirillum sp.]|nr:hypothetical protein [Magnetospirillum sp.]